MLKNEKSAGKVAFKSGLSEWEEPLLMSNDVEFNCVDGIADDDDGNFIEWWCDNGEFVILEFRAIIDRIVAVLRADGEDDDDEALNIDWDEDIADEMTVVDNAADGGDGRFLADISSLGAPILGAIFETNKNADNEPIELAEIDLDDDTADEVTGSDDVMDDGFGDDDSFLADISSRGAPIFLGASFENEKNDDKEIIEFVAVSAAVGATRPK